MPKSNAAQLKFFFEPRSVAVIGASRKAGKIGNVILKNLLIGFEGEVFPVNPNTDKILGLIAYPTIDAIPRKIDTAIIVTPPATILRIMKECARKHVKAVIIISGGFSEASNEGRDLEDKIVEIAKKANMRIIGPNTTGIVNTSNGFTSSILELDKMVEGGVAFIAQTGNFGGVVFKHILSFELFGISKVIGLGNKCDVADEDILEYLEGDPKTKVIAIYIESVKNGRRFFEVLRRVSRKKPIVIVKSGITVAGMKAALSHTGSIAGNNDVFSGVCRQAGILRINAVDDQLDLIKALECQPLPKGKCVALISFSGANCVRGADLLEEFELTPAKLSPESLEKLRDVSPQWHKLSNPIDVMPSIALVGPDDAYDAAIEVAVKDRNIDAILVDFGATFGMCPNFHKLSSSLGKPILFSAMGRKSIIEEKRKQLKNKGFPMYISLDRAIKVIAGMCKIMLMRNRYNKNVI